MQALTALMLPWTGFICAVAMLSVIVNITFHRRASPLFCLIKIYKHLSNNQGQYEQIIEKRQWVKERLNINYIRMAIELR